MGTATSAAATSSPGAPKRAGLVLTALILGAFACNVNLSVANVALPDIGRSLGASQTQLTLIATGCSLGLAMSVLYFGALGDRYGRKLLLVLGLALTVPASLLSAWAPNPELLILGRVATGLASGMAYPTTLALITALWAAGAARTKAIALWSSVSGGAAALGPFVAGALLERFWWGSVFLIAVPLAVVCVALVVVLVPAHVNESTERVDHAGGVLSVLMIAALVTGIANISSPGYLGISLALLGAAALLVIAFVLREQRAANPLYDLHYARRRMFWAPAVTGLIAFGALMGTMFVGQQFLQNVLDYSTFQAGAAILPGAIGMVLVARPSAALLGTRGSRVTMLVGFVLLTSAFTVMLVGWKQASPYWIVGLAYLLMGSGAGFALTAASRALMSSIPVTRVGMGSGTSDLQRDLGGSILQALLGAILAFGYAASFSRQIAGSPEASEVSAQTQTELLHSFSSAEAIGQQYPQYQAQIIEAARESFLSGANWAYATGLLAVVVGGVIAALAIPRKADEEALFAGYAKADAQPDPKASASGAATT